jgi:hypothetical protein
VAIDLSVQASLQAGFKRHGRRPEEMTARPEETYIIIILCTTIGEDSYKPRHPKVSKSIYTNNTINYYEFFYWMGI